MRLEKQIYYVDDALLDNITVTFGQFVALLMENGFPPPPFDERLAGLKQSLPGMIGGTMRPSGEPMMSSIVLRHDAMLLTSTEIYHAGPSIGDKHFYKGKYYNSLRRFNYLHMIDLQGESDPVRNLAELIRNMKTVQGYEATPSFSYDL